MTAITNETSYIPLNKSHYIYVTLDYLTNSALIHMTGKLRRFAADAEEIFNKIGIELCPSEREKLLFHYSTDKPNLSSLTLKGGLSKTPKLQVAIARNFLFQLKDGTLIQVNEGIISYKFILNKPTSTETIRWMLESITSNNISNYLSLYSLKGNQIVTISNSDDTLMEFDITNEADLAQVMSYLFTEGDWQLVSPIVVEFLKAYPSINPSCTASRSLVTKLRTWLTNLQLRIHSREHRKFLKSFMN